LEGISRESHVHRNKLKVAEISSIYWLSYVSFSDESGSYGLTLSDEESHLYSMSIHHPAGIAVEVVGIEASGNRRSCYQHDVCGSVLGDDVVVRLRMVQIINSSGKEETAIAAYLVSDGIDQCRVGFLQRHFVAHARSFNGVLAQVTEVYSITSDSSIKRKKCCHNMGCCLAALISK